jgi:hypothetical protein
MNAKNKSKPPTRPTNLNENSTLVDSSSTEELSINITESVINVDESFNTESVISRPLVQVTSQAQVQSSPAINLRYDYKVIVTRNSLDIFQLTVTEHLNDGWELSGGVSCTMYSDSYSASTIWSQALYKKITK